MRNKKSGLRQKYIFRLISGFLFLTSPFILGAQSLWEGSAAIGSYGALPVRGLYGASNSFPRNTLVEIENLENGNSTEIIIVDRLENSSFLVLLSQEAGTELGIGASGVIRVRATLGEAEKTDSYSLNNDQVYSSDPDINPAAGAEYSAAESADTEELLALSVFPVEEPVAPLESEAAKAASAVAEAEPEPEPEIETEPEVEIAEAEPAEPVIEEPVEPEPVDTEEPAEVIELDEPEPKIVEKTPKPEEPKKDPVVDVADESMETIIEEGHGEDIVMEEPAEPVIEEIAEAEPEEEPELEPIEYVPDDEPVITYVSDELAEPAGEADDPLASLNLPGIDAARTSGEAVEEVVASSFPLAEPERVFDETLYSIQLPEEPEIVKVSTGEAEIVEEAPIVETLVYLGAEGEETLPPPILPSIMEKTSTADSAEAVSPEDTVLVVESGYSSPLEPDTSMRASHLPDEPIEDTSEEYVIAEDETPLLINGYKTPVWPDETYFGQAALPVDPTASVEIGDAELTEETPVLISGLPTPSRRESLRFAQAALPEEPGADIAEYELAFEIPTAVNGFVEPESEEIGEFAAADIPSVPEEPYTAGPETVNGFMEPSGVDGEDFASAAAPEAPEEVYEGTPDAINGFMEPEAEEAVELAAADEPEIRDEPVIEPEVEPEPVAAPGEEEKIEIEVPVYEGEVEIVLSPAEERPPEIVDIPEIVEGAETPADTEEDTEIDVAEAAVPAEPEKLPSLDVILGPADAVADVPEPVLDVEPADEPEIEIAAAVPDTVRDVTAPVVEVLEQGYHYIQVGVYGEKAGASTAVNSIKGWSPVPVVIWTPESVETRFKVMVGPLTPDESGVMLFNLKGKGYRDAFLRKVVEPN